MTKKIISAIVNAIAILMVLVSIGILTFGAAGGNALEYVSQPVQSKSGPLSVKIKEELCAGTALRDAFLRIQAAGVSAAGVSAATG